MGEVTHVREHRQIKIGEGFTEVAQRREFPDVAFHDFASWAEAQDWNTLLQGA